MITYLLHCIGPICKELWAHKTRLFLTILAMAWGTFTINTLLAIGHTISREMLYNLQATGANLVYLRGGQSSDNYAGQSQRTVNLDTNDLHNIQHNLANIKRAIGIYSFWGPDAMQANNNRPGFHQITGIPVNYADIHAIQLTPGSRLINPLDIAQQRRVLVIGSQIARNLYPNNPNPVGEKLSLMKLDFTVIGIISPQQPSLSLGETPLAFQVLMPDSTLVAIKNPLYYSAIIIQAKANYNTKRMQNNLQKMIAQRQHLNPEDANIIYVSDGRSMLQSIRDILLGLQIFLGLVGSLTLIVAGIGIANVVYISVVSATPTIGMRMALGAKSWQIILHYLLEASIVTFSGGAIGLLASALACMFISALKIHAFALNMVLQPQLSWPVTLSVCLILGAIGFMSGYFPARKAAAIDPAVALRHS